MRVSLIPAALVAGATLVAASPLRVEVITVEQVNGPVPAPFRFGHAAHQGNNELVAEMVRIGDGATTTTGGRGGRGRKPCNGMGRSRSAFRTKALELSNAFRKALGLPVIVEMYPVHSTSQSSRPSKPTFVEHIAPLNNHGKKVEEEFHVVPFMPDQPAVLPVDHNDNDVSILPHPHPHRIHHHGHPHGHIHRFDKAPFVDRLLISIGMLGKWEGRAVAFVFGAGLGVLLRMFYVLTVVAFRTMKRSNRPTEEQQYVIFVEELEQEAEPTPINVVAPPQYMKDEKAPIPAEN
jgi:hypothetical protein